MRSISTTVALTFFLGVSASSGVSAWTLDGLSDSDHGGPVTLAQYYGDQPSYDSQPSYDAPSYHPHYYCHNVCHYDYYHNYVCHKACN